MPMINDPNELISYIKPFFPHDPTLAISAVSKLFPNLPAWISEMIVFEFFQALGMQAGLREYVKKFLQYDDVLSGKAKDLSLPMDLSQPLSVN